MWYTYVLYSKKQNKFYIGSTSDLKQRLKDHESKAVYTTARMAQPRLVYYEVCHSKKDAQVRERHLKTGFGRGYLRRRLEDYLLGP